MRIIKPFSLYILLEILILSPVMVYAEKNDARLYTTREEKREAGIKHRITPWLIISGLAEFEWTWEKFRLDETDSLDITDTTTTNVQISTFIIPFDWFKSEIITEYDSDIGQIKIDEVELSLEYKAWELAFGKFYLPFGNFVSHFSNGPLIEFGETRDETVLLAYNYNDIVDISVAAYHSKAHKINSDSHIDWSAAVEFWPADNLSVGASFISDLADSEQQLLGDIGHQYRNKVPAINAYIIWAEENYEISIEALAALESFHELDSDRNQPVAFNLEYAYFVTSRLDFALRIEGSQELSDSPEIQFGVAANYRFLDNIVLTTEILHGLFKDNIALDNQDNAYGSVTKFGALLSIGF